jgi:PPE-repeat protein
LQTLVEWITHKVSVTQAAAEAYTLAASTVIPSLLSQTNRDETATLHATNFMGVNTPAIVERDTEYFGEHWPHNSGVGTGYSSVLTGLTGSLGVPPPPAPMGASPAAPAAAGTAVAESAAETAGQDGLQASMAAAETPARAAAAPSEMTGQLGSFLQQGPQLASSMTDPLKSVASAPTEALQSFSSAPQALMSAFSAVRPTDALSADAAVTGAVSEPFRAGAGAATGVTGGAGGVGGYPGAALTNYTRPASTFSPENSGRPTGRAGVLNAAELHGPTSSGARGGAPMPMSPAGMLGRGNTSEDRNEATRARIVVDPVRSADAIQGGRKVK